jgi:competence protein ComEC
MTRSFDAALEALRDRPRHLLLGALVAGLLAAPGAPRIVVLLAVAAMVLAGRRGVAFVAGLAVLAGALIGQARLAALDHTELRPLLGSTVSARVALLEQPHAVRFGSVAFVELRGWDAPTRGAPSPARALGASRAGDGASPLAASNERILLRIGSRVAWPALPTGAIVLVRGRLRALGPFESYQRRRGAHAALVLKDAAWTGAMRGGVWRPVDSVRSRAETALRVGLPAPQAALFRGMVLGEDQALDPRTRADFRTSGLSHLTAASGANVALLAALALPLLSWASVGLRGRLAAVLALIALYVPLAGAGPSIQRAGVMGAATTAATLTGRPASRSYALLLAAAVTLILNPRASGDIGWQLSFAAVVAIVLLAPGTRTWLRARRVPEPIADALAVTLAATLGTAPLLMLRFSQLSLVSLPANLLAAPAVAPIMWLGMIGAALGQVATALALPCNLLAACLLGYVGWVAHAAAGVPHANLRVGLGGPLALVAVYAGIALVVLALRRLPRGAPAIP